MMINNNPLFRGGLAALLFLSCTAAIFRNNQAGAPQANSASLQKQHAIREQTFMVPFDESTGTTPEFDQEGAEIVRRLGGYGYDKGRDSDKSSKDSSKSSKDSSKSSKDSSKSSKDSYKSSKDSYKSSKDSSKDKHLRG
ncbi:predicted protein [Phaeodactylum tricornutum CCAP 1055/1]|uniref:Uncharacterized protein n=2 Tax=Phaeodactylum tricornutum TaxID=2850 RepID=B7G0V5_PHATC|nr:predicted protein [Phaeodactylum tricornutum CCAP 1055/1]EEC47389.1 predicted protein [Phaeodactylum tricornutum CCAP 1055/1]|eukprot:XP_002180737.1 predicted protein [Phaeodactylum tricornutum CCAP 1055/1]